MLSARVGAGAETSGVAFAVSISDAARVGAALATVSGEGAEMTPAEKTEVGTVSTGGTARSVPGDGSSGDLASFAVCGPRAEATNALKLFPNWPERDTPKATRQQSTSMTMRKRKALHSESDQPGLLETTLAGTSVDATGAAAMVAALTPLGAALTSLERAGVSAAETGAAAAAAALLSAVDESRRAGAGAGGDDDNACAAAMEAARGDTTRPGGGGAASPIVVAKSSEVPAERTSFGSEGSGEIEAGGSGEAAFVNEAAGATGTADLGEAFAPGAAATALGSFAAPGLISIAAAEAVWLFAAGLAPGAAAVAAGSFFAAGAGSLLAATLASGAAAGSFFASGAEAAAAAAGSLLAAEVGATGVAAFAG